MPLDSDDISDLYARHARQLVTFFARRTFDAETAVELMAETFAGAVANRRSSPASTPDEAVGWLYTIAHRRHTDWLRHAEVRRKALSQLGIEAPHPTDADLERIDELAGTAGLRAHVATQLLALPAQDQEALRLRVVEERSYEEVAERLGLSESGARTRVSRALQALTAAIGESER